jgi:glyoxylase-like metal-dependent hydrolase (beta-lactamase superfamily II)
MHSRSPDAAGASSFSPARVEPTPAPAAQANEAGIEQVLPNLWRITVPLPFELRWANAYLLFGAGSWCLVDAGLATPEAEAVMLEALASLGLTPADLSTIVVTHAHPDHIGLAGRFQEASGAPVLMFGLDAQIMRSIWTERDMRSAEMVSQFYTSHGMPAEDSNLEKASMVATRRLITVPSQVTALEDGQEVLLVGERYQVIWTPGHSDGHMCLWRASDGVLLAGDHILPRITPNIGLYPRSRPNPLGDYLESLQRLRPLPARLVLPGHGRPFADLSGRVDELLAHHEERSEITYQLVDQAQHEAGDSAHTGDITPTDDSTPAGVTAQIGVTAHAVAIRLFEGRFHSLQNRRFALAETLAHLEYLRLQGRLEWRQDQAGKIHYFPAPAA